MGCLKLIYGEEEVQLKVVRGIFFDDEKSCTGTYLYGYNGKENDNEIHGSTGSVQNYGMRMYDTRLGRFFSADPLIVQDQQYPELSPYQFASNTPIWAIDLDGLEAKVYYDTRGVGHTFISVTDDQGVLHIYTYGQYGQGTKDGESKAYGEGALVHLVGKDAEAYLKRGFNDPDHYSLSVYELGETEVDKDKIMEYYDKILNDPNAVPAEKVNDVRFVKDDPNSKAVKYSKYGGVPMRCQDNCVTVADEGLEAGGSNILLNNTIPDLAQNDAEMFSWFESDITEVTEEVRTEYVTK
ncbi:MAG: hypothetical protein K2X86_08595 [Cytophagaceae bacterium]|nr:hypothetical protein [Cytophagaceae bacterium]